MNTLKLITLVAFLALTACEGALPQSGPTSALNASPGASTAVVGQPEADSSPTPNPSESPASDQLTADSYKLIITNPSNVSLRTPMTFQITFQYTDVGGQKLDQTYSKTITLIPGDSYEIDEKGVGYTFTGQIITPYGGLIYYFDVNNVRISTGSMYNSNAIIPGLPFGVTSYN